MEKKEEQEFSPLYPGEEIGLGWGDDNYFIFDTLNLR